MHLLEPLRIGHDGRHLAPTRVVFGPHETNLGGPAQAAGRAIGPRHVAYYARRAAGGAGVIVTEEASVHPSDWPYERCPAANECGPGWRAVADACRSAAASAGDAGAPLVLAAIGHSGGQGATAYSQAPLWAPSPVPEVATREVPKIMEADEIDAVVAGFGDAARRAVASGLDGVEVNIGQYSLVRQFLSGLTNQRGNDGYGTDRLRFAGEVLAAVRTAAGRDALVAVRLSVDEMAPWAGIVPDAGAEIAVALAGWIDLLTVVRGSIFTAWATRPDAHEPAGFALGLAAGVRAALHDAGHGRVAVVAQGSIVDPAMAEAALRDGGADAVEMTRAQLADADLVAKLRAGTPERIRPCIRCNQTCKVRDNRNPIVTCVVDPRTGHETDDEPEPVERPSRGRTMSIVGAGVAGLECARVAASDGWDVCVWERSDAAGGALRLAAGGAGRSSLAAIADWLEAECTRLGVRLELGHAVTEDEVAAMAEQGPVVLCTGGRNGDIPFTVADDAVVVHATDWLAGRPLPDGAVAVWDPIGGPIAISVVERLAGEGRTVTLVTPDLLVGEKLSLTGDLAPAQARLHGSGVVLVKRALVRRVGVGRVEVEDRFSGAASVAEAAALVACGHRLPDHSLGGDGAVRAGDAVAPRTVLEAVLEGRRAAQHLRASRLPIRVV